jgi:uncharacterized cupredoxin-like copper-binding protein
MRAIARTAAAAAAAVAVALSAVPLVAQEGEDEAPLVHIALTEFSLGFNERLVESGPIRLDIQNSGTILHAFAIEIPHGDGTAVVATPHLEPGEQYRLVVELPPGAYTVYCPVGDHREQGMRGTLVVRSGD